MVSWTQFLIYSYLSCVTVRLNIIKNSLDHITSLFKLQCKQINLCCRCWAAQSCLTPCDPVKIWCYQSFLFVSFWCHEVESDCGLNLFSSDEQWSWTSFINGHLHTFAAFRIFPHEIFTFFLLVCWNSLHILRLSPLVKYMNCKYFLLLCGWLSTLKEVNFFFCLFDVLVQGPYIIQETYLNLADCTLSHSCFSVLPELHDEKDVSGSIVPGNHPRTTCPPCLLGSNYSGSHRHM